MWPVIYHFQSIHNTLQGRSCYIGKRVQRSRKSSLLRVSTAIVLSNKQKALSQKHCKPLRSLIGFPVNLGGSGSECKKQFCPNAHMLPDVVEQYR
jgi:hypothetical protein